ncbi:C40 family peptidase [Actinacidiphila acididurans]|uniref:C40 family peptidase n=1 Tax=Actinacidiphila acididurans TaxID=2784346 RepID=UPI001F3B3F5D|nr:C40 family peptidase [Actinacidiphila acididurans]
MSVVRRSKAWLRSAVVCGSLLAAASLSLPVAQQAAARPYDPPAAAPVALPQLLAQLQSLYSQAESATEAYDRAARDAATLRARANAIDAQLADQKVAVAGSRAEAGLIARQMYQDGGMSPYLSMLAGQTPQDFFGQQHIIQRAAGHQKDVVTRLTAGEAKLKDLNTQAQRALDRAEHAQALQQANRTRVQNQLKQVEALLAGLSGSQIGQLQALEQQGTDKAQQQFLASRTLGAGWQTRAPSSAGDRAIAYAYQQLGKPYVWGAQGPDAFDCSGLTSQAWLHAGVVIPRTSQEQWAQLPHVPLDQLRPGDLVIYFSGASHVAIYIGDGLVIQAPRPGAFVKVSPIAANPVLGAVRPDPGDQPLPRYTVPPIPKQAEAPTPITSGNLTNPPGAGGSHPGGSTPGGTGTVAAPPARPVTTPPTAPATPGSPASPSATPSSSPSATPTSADPSPTDGGTPTPTTPTPSGTPSGTPSASGTPSPTP